MQSDHDAAAGYRTGEVAKLVAAARLVDQVGVEFLGVLLGLGDHRIVLHRDQMPRAGQHHRRLQQLCEHDARILQRLLDCPSVLGLWSANRSRMGP
jgi:hypothetical protein